MDGSEHIVPTHIQKTRHHIIGSYIFGYGTDDSKQNIFTYNMDNIAEEYP